MKIFFSKLVTALLVLQPTIASANSIQFKATRLEPTIGAAMFVPQAINAKGQIAGALFSYGGSDFIGTAIYQPGYWGASYGTTHLVSRLQLSISGISESGEIYGAYNGSAALWRPNAANSLTGELEILAIPFARSEIVSISDSNTFAVNANNASFTNHRALTLTPSQGEGYAIFDLGDAIGSASTSLRAASSSGLLLGHSKIGSTVFTLGSQSHPDLTAEAVPGSVWAVNSLGVVAGSQKPLPNSGQTIASIASPTPGGYISRTIASPHWGGGTSFSRGINDLGWVIGEYQNVNGSFPFFWTEENGAQDFSSLLQSGQNVSFNVALGISNSGQIIVWNSRNDTGYVLTPVNSVPEISTISLLFFGLAFLQVFYRRQTRRGAA